MVQFPITTWERKKHGPLGNLFEVTQLGILQTPSFLGHYPTFQKLEQWKWGLWISQAKWLVFLIPIVEIYKAEKSLQHAGQAIKCHVSNSQLPATSW